jgi:hypothetical protein
MGLLIGPTGLDFKQSSLCHITRVLQSNVLGDFSRPPLSQYALLALTLSAES